MKNNMRSIVVGFVMSVLFLSSCSFGFVPSWKEKEKAIISIQFKTLDSIVRATDGSRAIIQGDGFLYIRTLGGPKGDKGPLYGPYKVTSGSVFETNDIPAGTYSKGIAVLFSAIELGTHEAALKSPDDQFLAGEGMDALVDALSGIASGAISEPMTIDAGQKNSLSLTLVPVVNEASILDMNFVKTYTVTPADSGGSVKKFIMLDNVDSNVPDGDSIKDLVCMPSGTGTLSQLALYDAVGTLVPNIARNAETGIFTVPYTTGTTFYLYIECSGEPVHLTFSSIYTSGATSEDTENIVRTEVTLPVTISGAGAEQNAMLYFQIIPTFYTLTSYAEGSIDIQSDGTGSGQTLSMMTGLPIPLETGTYDLVAYIDINGNEVSGLDGLDAGEPFYVLDGLVITESQTAIALTRASFTTISPYPGHVFYVANIGINANDGSSPANATTLTNAMTLIDGLLDDDQMNWIVLTENIMTVGDGTFGYTLFPNKEVTITSNLGYFYSITLDMNFSSGPLFDVVTDASLSLMDVTVRGNSTETYYAPGGLVMVYGEFNMLSENTYLMDNISMSATNGGGVRVFGGTFTMSGGVISNCNTTAPDVGGGVYVEGGTFNMFGGEISGCSAYRGGGVYINNGYMVFAGDAAINDNISTYEGGGLYLAVGLTGFDFVYDSQLISGNTIKTVNDWGSGVYVADSIMGDTAYANFVAATGCVIDNFYNGSIVATPSVTGNIYTP